MNSEPGWEQYTAIGCLELDSSEGKSMKSFQNEDLVGLLSDGQADLRMKVLHTLCEGYASQREIFDAVLAGWDRWGPAEAYHEFPMLSYLAIPPDAIDDCCSRAAAMVEGRKLTELPARCAGKLLEQVIRLDARTLIPKLDVLESVTAKSKIFFRVDLEGVRYRIGLLDKSADELAGVLDAAVEQLGEDSNSVTAVHQALAALETLRREYPEYLDLQAAIANAPEGDGAAAISFQLTMQSLVQFDHPGLEATLAKHLLDAREAIHSTAVEALVHAGGAATAEAFLEKFDEAEPANQKWIARGLQRIRVPGLAGPIAVLRAGTTDPALWLMLLIAELRQLDPSSNPRVAEDLARLQSFSEALIDSLTVFARLHEGSEGARDFQGAFMEYLKRANSSLSEQLIEKKRKMQRSQRKQREQAKKRAIVRYRKNK